MAQVATKNIYEFLADESHEEEEQTVKPTATKSTTKPVKVSNKPKTAGSKIQAARPPVQKEGQFFEKPQHKQDATQKKHHQHAKPLKGRQFDKKSTSFKKDEKLNIVDAELEKTQEYFY